ncbi:hypothetical protein AAVH_08898 [Aphelenchoides avenae]|nr:hypothetical protein AAVH_08898 [Aphelenchus avenae]
MSLGVRLIFAMKPTIDAIFTLLFLGEYRQYPINCYKWLREKLIGKKGQSTTRVTEFQRRAPAAHNAIPSTVSGHINNLREGTRPSGIGRSSSLPVKITTISA